MKCLHSEHERKRLEVNAIIDQISNKISSIKHKAARCKLNQEYQSKMIRELNFLDHDIKKLKR